jgi:glycosyltransferase involved in cell wall biosynthesis
MKILQIIPHFYPALSFGGPVTFTYELCKHLAARGHDVTIYTSDADKNRIKEVGSKKLENSRISVKYFSNISNSLACKYNFYLTPAFYPEMIKNMAKFDVVHMHELYVLQNIFAALFAKRKGISFVISAHGSLTNVQIRGKTQIKSLFQKIGFGYYHQATRFLALSEKEKEEYKASGFDESRIEILPTGVEKFIKSDLKEIQQFKKKYLILPDNKIILYIGRLHPIKRLDLLIRSFVLVRRKNKNAYLIIAGPDGGEKKKLKQMAKELLPENSYIFTGNADEKLKNVLLSIADVFVMVSYTEGLSKSLLEASSAGLPVVVTKSCNYSEVTKYHCGMETEAKEEQISYAIAEIFSNHRENSKFGENGKKMIEQNFLWEKTIVQYIDLYREASRQV